VRAPKHRGARQLPSSPFPLDGPACFQNLRRKSGRFDHRMAAKGPATLLGEGKWGGYNPLHYKFLATPLCFAIDNRCDEYYFLYDRTIHTRALKFHWHRNFVCCCRCANSYRCCCTETDKLSTTPTEAMELNVNQRVADATHPSSDDQRNNCIISRDGGTVLPVDDKQKLSQS